MNQVNTPATVVVVEDDTEISRLTLLLLESEGFSCEAVFRGDDAVDVIRDRNPDIVILDIMLPGLSGIDVCARIREFYSGAVLMLTGRDDDISELASFKQGADDYVVKPIKPHLLLARMTALLKRTRQPLTSDSGPLVVGDLSIDPATRSLHMAGVSVSLTSAEFDVLELLAKQAGEIVSRESCCEQLRGLSYDGVDRSIDMRISSLRKKLGDNGRGEQRILTVRGRGYMLVKAS